MARPYVTSAPANVFGLDGSRAWSSPCGDEHTSVFAPPVYTRILALPAQSLATNAFRQMPGALSPAPRPIPGTVDWQDAGHMRDCPVAIFIVTLRWYMEELPSEHTGWPAGARDPVVGAALVLLHRKPCHAWTIAGLASEVGTSRTVLTERFDRFLGEPPLTYLARWRLQLAARKLQTTQEAVLNVAGDVGLVRGRLQPCLQARVRSHRRSIARASTEMASRLFGAASSAGCTAEPSSAESTSASSAQTLVKMLQLVWVPHECLERQVLAHTFAGLATQDIRQLSEVLLPRHRATLTGEC